MLALAGRDILSDCQKRAKRIAFPVPMNFFQTLGIALALSTDAMVVAFSYGVILRAFRHTAALKLATSTGFFQALMPLLGFLAATGIYHHCVAWAHWIAFGVFGVLGCSVIGNALFGKREDAPDSDCARGKCRLGLKKLLAIGVATSLDALAVGAGMRCMNAGFDTFPNVLAAAAVIGAVTFFGVLAAFHVSRFFKCFPQRAMELFAGLILLSLGIITLIRHFCAEAV